MSSQTTHTQPTTPPRDDGLTVISIWHYLVGGIFLLSTAALMLMTLVMGAGAVSQDAGLFIPMTLFGIMTLVFMLLALINLAVGYGLWTQRPWARTGALALAVVGLIFAPLGTIAGAFILWYLLRPETTAHFSPQAHV
jgi:hypothetical protein